MKPVRDDTSWGLLTAGTKESFFSRESFSAGSGGQYLDDETLQSGEFRAEGRSSMRRHRPHRTSVHSSDGSSGFGELAEHPEQGGSANGWARVSVDGGITVDRESSATLPLLPSGRKSNDLSSFTVNKLNFAQLGLHGRQEEVNQLNEAYDKLESTVIKRHLMLIAGESGTGKTKLATTLMEKTKKANGLFIRGKFDLKQRNQPYSAFAMAWPARSRES